MTDDPRLPEPSASEWSNPEGEDFGPTTEDRLIRRRRLLWTLAIAVLVGATTWIAGRVVSLWLQRPGVKSTKGIALALEWLRITEPAAYGLMVGALAAMGGLLLLDVLHQRLTGSAAFAKPSTGSVVSDLSDRVQHDPHDDEDEQDEEEDLAEADLTDEEYARMVLAERLSRRDFRPAVLVGARIALVTLGLAAITWAGSSAAAAFFFPGADAFVFAGTSPETNLGTYVLMQQISATAQAIGLAMLAFLGGSVLVHDLGHRLRVPR